MDKNKNIFSQLADYFDSDIQGVNNKEKRKTIIRASNKEEAIRKSIETSAQEYLFRQYSSIVQHNKDYTQIVEVNRIRQYMDYTAMEYYPIIGIALDIMAEEATTRNDEGNVINIYSSNPDVKKRLEELFFQILDVNTSLFHWTRNTLKYGDTFLYMLPVNGKGITAVRILDNLQIERIEEEIDGKIKTKFLSKNNYNPQQFSGHNHRSTYNAEYTNWQIAHFRLLGDNRQLPYGVSMLDKVRRTWKMLSLVEDAMLVYRLSRAAERRVYKVFVGNAPVEDIPSIMQIAQSQVKKQQLIDKNTGDLNWQFNPATNDADIFVPVRSENATSPIETLAGAANLSDIEDISYLRNNLYTGLGIPKPFVSTEEAVGDGRALSMMDMRLARKAQRIQQSMIAELNKIAIIHLYSLGGDYSRYISDFTITMNNPSLQSDILRTEILTNKTNLYNALTTKSDKNISIMSHYKAKKEVFNMSDKEIIEDYIKQFTETKIGTEIDAANELIKNSGLFNEIIKELNNRVIGEKPIGMGQQGGNDGMGAESGFGGGMDLGGGMGATTGSMGGMDLGGIESGSDSGTDIENQGEATDTPEIGGAESNTETVDTP